MRRTIAVVEHGVLVQVRTSVVGIRP
jgi:hypothetical protein